MPYLAQFWRFSFFLIYLARHNQILFSRKKLTTSLLEQDALTASAPPKTQCCQKFIKCSVLLLSPKHLILGTPHSYFFEKKPMRIHRIGTCSGHKSVLSYWWRRSILLQLLCHQLLLIEQDLIATSQMNQKKKNSSTTPNDFRVVNVQNV